MPFMYDGTSEPKWVAHKPRQRAVLTVEFDIDTTDEMPLALHEAPGEQVQSVINCLNRHERESMMVTHVRVEDVA